MGRAERMRAGVVRDRRAAATATPALTASIAMAEVLAIGVAEAVQLPNRREARRALDAALARRRPALERAKGVGQRPALPPLRRDMAKARRAQIECNCPHPFGTSRGAAAVTRPGPIRTRRDAKLGWCAGTRAVADLQDWTLPGEGAGQPIEVRFTWHLVDVPAWARRPEFDDVPGLQTPVPGVAVLQRTSTGWAAT